MNIKNIIIYEPEGVEKLYPFSILHCGWEVRCGASRLFEKITKLFPGAKIFFRGRDKHLVSFLARFNIKLNDNLFDSTQDKGSTLFLNASIIINSDCLKELSKADIPDDTFFLNNGVVAGFIAKTDDKELYNNYPAILNKINKFQGGNSQNVYLNNIHSINYLWDAIDLTGEEITNDSIYFKNSADFELLKKSAVYLLNEDKIKLGKNVVIDPYVVIDAREGDVIIGNNVKIMSHSSIEGPCFIGDNSIVKFGAKIYGKTSIGEFCKVGGEIENAIIHAYSNKQHEGFLGHSYIGEWVNLGADTNTSDLKNTYSEISVLLDKEEIKTGRQFLGLLCGDHSKSAINSMFTTGTVAGICGILLGEGFMPRSIPSFSWGGKKDSPKYKLSKALEVAKIVLKRRNKTLLPEEEELIKMEFEKL